MSSLNCLFVHAAVLLCLLLQTAPASAESGMEIAVPKTIGVGQPFLATFSLPPGSEDLRIFWNGRSIPTDIREQDGRLKAVSLLGVGLKAMPGLYSLEWEVRLNNENRRFRKLIRAVPFAYQKETLSVAPKMIKPPASELERIRRERERSREVINSMSEGRKWHAPFSLPVKGKMLSRFGLYRTFNGEAKRRHWGLDFRAYLGTPIHSIAPGTVVLVGNHYYAGNCVFIDHGNGVISMSVHMSKVLVKEGQEIRRGQKIGLSGSTGRSTGAHLHLSVFAQGVAVDPEPLFLMNEDEDRE